MSPKKAKKWTRRQRRDGRGEKLFVPPPRATQGDSWAARREADALRAAGQTSISAERLASLLLLKASKPIYVRWLGAYRRPIRCAADLNAALAFEFSTRTVRPCAGQPRVAPLGDARIGLGVDPRSINRCFSGDVHSRQTEEGGLAADPYTIAYDRINSVDVGDRMLRLRRVNSDYREAWGIFAFTCIYVHVKTPRRLRKVAAEWAKRKRLRIVYFA